jgi:hypothetical protein
MKAMGFVIEASVGTAAVRNSVLAQSNLKTVILVSDCNCDIQLRMDIVIPGFVSCTE